VLAEIQRRPWLGNVRELRNFVERAAALGVEEALAATSRAAGPVGPGAVGGGLPSPDIDRPFKDVRDEWLTHLEREYLRGWLERTGGNVTAVAEAIGLDRTYVHRLMKKHDLVR
jgi:DNA-binding NtrC family response regulator